MHKFRNIIQLSDRVVTYDPARREYLLGTVRGDYQYDARRIPEHPHQRRVEWAGHVGRDVLSSASKNSPGSFVTLEPGHQVLAELEAKPGVSAIQPSMETVPAQEGESEFEVARQDAAGRAHELLKNRLLRLSPEEMEQIVAAMLRAMGYKARVTPKGPDRGRDVVASPDGLGFQHPRVFAEVKHRPREPVTLVDLDRLAELIVEHYERLDEEGRALVPLARVYWPAS